MRVFFLIVVFCLTACASQKGEFVDRGLFNNTPFVTAKAADPDMAQALALAAMPAGFERDKEFNAPVMSCGLPGEAPVWDEARKANAHCPSGTYRVDLALIPSSGPERDAILQTRQNGEEAFRKQD
ncbi:MAG: hypothetical protein ACXVCK_11395, partial [Bdellovibrionota bacterium]